MPWTCAPCEQSVGDAAACPSCGASKTSWTIIPEETRRLSVARKRFRLLVGTDVTPRAPGDPALAAVELVPATEVVALARDDVLELAAAGLLPATADTLFVALEGPGATKGDVTLEVLFAGRPSEEVVIAGPAPSDGHVKVVLVYGAGGTADLALDGVHVVDVTEDDAHAPTVEVAAVARPAEALRVAALKDFSFSV